MKRMPVTAPITRPVTGPITGSVTAFVIALAGLTAFTGPALGQDSTDASQGSSDGLALSAEAAATLSQAGVQLAWTGSVATGQSAAIVFADELEMSQAVLDVWGEASGGPLPVDERVMVAGPRPDVPRQVQQLQDRP